MSNLILNLQNGLINNPIYNDIKNEEIINLIEEYNNNPNDFIDYKNYFNEKCIVDYNVFLISNIINSMEKTLNKNNIHGDDGILENKLLFMFLRYKDNIRSFITKLKINKDDLLKNIPVVKQLKQKIDILTDLNKDVSDFKKKLDVFNNNIFDIITDDIQIYLDTDNISTLLKSFIKYAVKNNKRFINIKINYSEYNNKVVKKFTDSEYENLDEMINDLNSNNFSDNQELSYFITKYKISKNQSFKKLIHEFDNIDLNYELIHNYRNLNFESNFNNIKKHIFIEIMEICDQPFSQTYLDYLKNVYIHLDMDTQYNDILEQNKIHTDLIIEYENDVNIFFKSIIKKIKNNDKNLNLYVLKKSINSNFDKTQHDDLKKEVDFFEKLINTDNKSGVLNNYISNNNQKRLTELTEFNLIIDMNNVEKHLKHNPIDNDNDYIKTQLSEYVSTETKRTDHIFISLHSLFKNNNLTDFFNFMKQLEQKINYIEDPNLLIIFNESLHVFLSEIFNHYIKAINNFHVIDLFQTEYKLFYNYKNNDKIRVYVKDPIELILLEILKNPIKHQYVFTKLLEHLFNYKYYNVVLDIEETIMDKISHDVFLNRYINLISNINDKLDTPIFISKIKPYRKILMMKLPILEIKSPLLEIINFNIDYKIISDEAIVFLKNNWNDLNFLTFKKIINKKKMTKDDKIDALKFITHFTNNIDKTVHEKHINIYRNNHNNTEKKIIYNTAKELKKIMSKSFKFQSSNLINNKIDNLDFFKNYTVDISDIKKFETTDMIFSTMKILRNAYNDNKNENGFVQLINNTIQHNIKFFNNQFKQDINFKILYNNLLSDINKIKIIAKKFNKKISYNNIYTKLISEKKTFTDIISIVSIMFSLDNFINHNIDFDMKTFEKINNNSILNKKIFIIKSGLITTIISQQDEQFISSENIKLNRNDFILYDSIINQDVKIIKGNFKGRTGRLIKTNDNKNLSFTTTQNKKNQKQQIKYYDLMINDLNDVLYKLRIDNNSIFDDLELSELVQYRKDILKNNLSISAKYKLNIKINPDIRMILNDLETSFIKKLRSDRIDNISFNLKNLINEKKIFINNHKQQFIIRIDEGSKFAKNVFFTSDKFKLNKIKLLNDELNKDHIIRLQNIIIARKYTNLYDFIKYIFNYINVSDDNDNNQYFINIYTEAIKIFNINKHNNMSKVDIKNKIESDLIKLNKNIMILQKRISKKGNSDNKIQMKKFINLKNKRQNILDSINIDIVKYDLMSFKSIKKNPFPNDLDINDNVSYFKINSNDMKHDLKNIAKHKANIKILNDKQDIIDLEKIKILFYDIKQNIDDQFWDITYSFPEINIIEYLNTNFINNEQDDIDDDDESIDLDDILNELDNIEIDDEAENIKQIEREIGRKLTWIELDEI